MERIEGPKQPGEAGSLSNLAGSASSPLQILLKAIHDISHEEVHNCIRELMDKMPCELRILEGLSVPLTAARKVLNKAFPKYFERCQGLFALERQAIFFMNFFSDLKYKLIL
jgi:hypothetical protein